MSAGVAAPLGDELAHLCEGARDEVVLVAPFVKGHALARVLNRVPVEVPVRCVTRWRPDEIIAGVSDLEVWPLLEARGNATLRLSPWLHAKYYRGDDACLVGSANLTATALGWARRPNIELLLPLPASTPALLAFEAALWLAAVPVTAELHARFVEGIAVLRETLPAPAPASVELLAFAATDVRSATSPPDDISGGGLPHPTVVPEYWTPTLRHPESLYTVYSGDAERVSSASLADAQHDLAQLGIGPGLPHPAFDRSVRVQLLQMPAVQAVEAYVGVEPRRFGAVRTFLSQLPCAAAPDFDATDAWQALMRWLLYFAPSEYRVETANYSEIFGRRDHQHHSRRSSRKRDNRNS